MTRLKEAGFYVAPALAVFLALFFTLRLWSKDLSVPFDIAGDSLFWTAVVKATSEDGLFGPFRRLGMPFGSEFADWPMGTPLDFSVLRLLVRLLGTPGAAVNSYWLLSMVATGVTATFALRRLDLGRGPAFGLGVLYAVLPYAFQHNTGHLPLVYHFVPLIALLCLRIAEGAQADRGRGERALLLVACGLQGLSYIYYSFFSCGLLLLAGAIGWVGTKRWQGPRLALTAVAVLFLCSAASLAPSFWYWWKHGTNLEIRYKTAAEAEVYGLRIRQMLTPISDHPIGLFRRAAEEVEKEFPADGENASTRLGSVGSIGLLLLLGFSIAAIAGGFAEARAALGPAAALTLGTVLLAHPGGFGTLFSAFVVPDIRAYGRIVVFVAFFSFFAVGTVLDKLRATVASRRREWRWALLVAGILALCAGVRDQAATASLIANYADNASAFERDRAFVAQVESAMPPGGMVFQMPHTDIPVDRSRPPMVLYDHARAYVHARSLRWSWGDISGHQGNWQREIARLPPRELVSKLALAGFSGIWIDRYGYANSGPSPEAGLAEVTRSVPLVREDGRIVFLSLLRFQRDLEGGLGPEALAAARERVLTVPLVPRWGNGFYEEEGDGAHFWRWCTQRGRLVLKNTLKKPRRVTLRSHLRSGAPEGGVLRITSARFQEALTLAKEGTLFQQELVLDPGEKLKIDLAFTGKPMAARGDARAFQVIDFTVADHPDAEGGAS